MINNNFRQRPDGENQARTDEPQTRSLFAQLRAACAADWSTYTCHEFVQRIADGSLPRAAFLDYLGQDYRFLIQFARANALAAYKSRDLADIESAQQALAAIVAETHLHVRMVERWGISAQELATTVEKPTTIAYTRYVLDAGMAGDLLDLQVALAPCVVGYAEIGRQLADGIGHDHPYRQWIAEYADVAYQRTAEAAVDRLDQLADGHPSPRRMAELTEIFATSTRLEADFWQQSLDAVRGSRPTGIDNAPAHPA